MTPSRTSAWRIAEEEPVPAPRNVADELSRAVEIDHHVFFVAIAGHVLHGDVSRIVELRSHDADRRLDSMGSGLDVTEVIERRDQTDHSVTAHAEIAGVVEKNHGGGAGRIGRLAEKGTDEIFRAARLADRCEPKAIVIDAKPLETLGNRTHAEVGGPVDDDTRRLPGRVGVDGSHHPERAGHGLRFYWVAVAGSKQHATKKRNLR